MKVGLSAVVLRVEIDLYSLVQGFLEVGSLSNNLCRCEDCERGSGYDINFQIPCSSILGGDISIFLSNCFVWQETQFERAPSADCEIVYFL